MSWYEPLPSQNLYANTKLRYIVKTNEHKLQPIEVQPTPRKRAAKRKQTEDENLKHPQTKRKSQPTKKISPPKKKKQSEEIDETNFI